jgi:hypothetical protein
LTVDIESKAFLHGQLRIMTTVTLAEWEGIVLLGGFICVVVWKVATGEISLDYLLYGDARMHQGAGRATFFSSGRAQMLISTVTVAGYYLLQVIQDPTHFPAVPTELVAALGTSHAIYLGGKAQSLYLGRLRDLVSLLNRR